MLLPPVLAIASHCFRLLGFLDNFFFYIIIIINSRVRRLVDANMEVASSDDVALVKVLDPFGRGLDDVQFSFLFVARRCLHKALSRLAKRDLNVKNGRSEGSSRGGPSAPW